MHVALGVVAFLVSIAYWPGIDGASTSPRIAILAVTMWPFLQVTTFTAGHAALALTITWAALTGLWTPYPWDWVWAMAELLILGTVFWAGSVQGRSLRPIYIGLAVGLSISSAIAIGQHAHPQTVSDPVGFRISWLAWQGFPSGLFVNRNMLAEIAAMVTVGLIAEKLWWFIPLVAPSLVLPGSRGALVAFAVGTALVVPRIVAAGVFGLVLVVWACFSRGGFETIAARAMYWSTVIDELDVLGRGAGSFMGLFPPAVDRPVNVHNDFLQIAFDLGVVGALAYASLFLLVLRSDDVSSRAVLAAFLVEGLVGFPLHMPVTAMLFALVAGRLAGAGPELRVAAAVRRAALQGRHRAAQYRADRASGGDRAV